MPDTPTPAQADEKARDLLAVAARLETEATEAMAAGGMGDDCPDTMNWAAQEIRRLVAALRPEGEAVAFVDQSGPLLDIRWADAATAVSLPDGMPLYASPPAPTQVEAASLPAPVGVAGVKALEILDAHEAAARERADKFFEMDIPSTDPGAASAFAVRNKLIEIGEELRAALTTDASPSGESEQHHADFDDGYQWARDLAKERRHDD